MKRAEILERFINLIKDYEETPNYKEVRKRDPALLEAIFRKYGGYRTFCRVNHIPEPKPTKQQRAFIRYSSRCSRRYYRNNRWSTLDLKTKEILESLGFIYNLDFYHNYRMPSARGRTYELDIFFPTILLVFENNGLFHNLGNSRERDREKAEWLKKYGIKVVFLESKEFNDLGSLKAKVVNHIRERMKMYNVRVYPHVVL